MLDNRTKNILLALFALVLVLEIGSAVLYSMKYPDAPKQYAQVFEDWKGWLVLAGSVAAGAGTWYLLNDRKFY